MPDVKFDAAGGDEQDDANPSWSQSVAADASLGIVGAQSDDGDTTGATATWGGVSMVRERNSDTNLFYLINPPTGTPTISIGGMGAGGTAVSMSFRDTEVIASKIFRDSQISALQGHSLTLNGSLEGDMLASVQGRRSSDGNDPGNISWQSGEAERVERLQNIGSWQSRCGGATKAAPAGGGSMITSTDDVNSIRRTIAVIIARQPDPAARMILHFSEAWDRWRERADGLLTPKGFNEPIFKPEPQILTPTNLRRAA